MNVLVDHMHRRRLQKHYVQMLVLEQLLRRVKRQAAQLALDQIRAVFHHCLQHTVPRTALPSRNQMQHVFALCAFPVIPALLAAQLDLQHREQRLLRHWVFESDQAGIEVY